MPSGVSEGVLPGTDKTAIIWDAAVPDNFHCVRQFMGLCNLFKTCICDFTIRSHPLTILTRKNYLWKRGVLPHEPWKLLSNNTALISFPIIAFPCSYRQCVLIMNGATGDVSYPGGMGANLTHNDNDRKFTLCLFWQKIYRTFLASSAWEKFLVIHRP